MDETVLLYIMLILMREEFIIFTLNQIFLSTELCMIFFYLKLNLIIYRTMYDLFLSLHFSRNEEQITTGYLIDCAMGSSGGGRVRKLSVICLNNNAIVARDILVTILHCGTPEPCPSAI